MTLCGWRDVQGQRTFKVWTLNMTWTWQTLGEQPVLWTLQTLKSTDGEWPTEQYTHWMLQTLNWHWTLYFEPHNWTLDWTLPALNNRQTMNPIANIEHHYVCYRFYPIDWMLKKLNWWLWTLLALNAIELTDTDIVYTESYWRINSTELTLHWTLHNTERANCSEHYT